MMGTSSRMSQWAGFEMIGIFVMEELELFFVITIS